MVLPFSLAHCAPSNAAQTEVVKAHALVGLNQLLLGGTSSSEEAALRRIARLETADAR